MTTKNGQETNLLLEELTSVKKLLVLELLRGGASQHQVASALGIDQSQVSRMFAGGLKLPKRKGKG